VLNGVRPDIVGGSGNGLAVNDVDIGVYGGRIELDDNRWSDRGVAMGPVHISSNGASSLGLSSVSLMLFFTSLTMSMISSPADDLPTLSPSLPVCFFGQVLRLEGELLGTSAPAVGVAINGLKRSPDAGVSAPNWGVAGNPIIGVAPGFLGVAAGVSVNWGVGGISKNGVAGTSTGEDLLAPTISLSTTSAFNKPKQRMGNCYYKT